MKEAKVIDYNDLKKFLLERLNSYLYALREMDLDDDEFMKVGCYSAELIALMSTMGMVELKDLSESSDFDEFLAKTRS